MIYYYPVGFIGSLVNFHCDVAKLNTKIEDVKFKSRKKNAKITACYRLLSCVMYSFFNCSQQTHCETDYRSRFS